MIKEEADSVVGSGSFHGTSRVPGHAVQGNLGLDDFTSDVYDLLVGNFVFGRTGDVVDSPLPEMIKKM